MIIYRLNEFGVERIEDGQSTFIHADPTRPAWCEYQVWCALGNQPLEAPARFRPKKLWIIGAGGYGRELYSMSSGARGNGLEWTVAGFLNDISDALDAFPELPRIADGTDYEPREGDLFICAIGDVAGRKTVCEKFEARGACFTNIIQDTAMYSPSASLGNGIILEAYTGVGANTRVGDYTSILNHANVAHDVNIGRFVQIAPFASVLGWVEIGDEVNIGSHAVILPHVKIGARATIGAGSVVIRDVPENATVFGVPASRIK